MARFLSPGTSLRSVRFYEPISTTGEAPTIIQEAMTEQQKIYSVINNAHTSTSKTVSVSPAAGGVSGSITFVSTSLATVPDGFPTQSKNDFTIFINGVSVENDAVDSVVQSGANVVITLNSNIEYSIAATDEYMITGKLQA
jgi:hypothetical protein